MYPYPLSQIPFQPNGQIPVVQQQLFQNGQQSQQQQTQYVQLANGMLVPMSTLEQPQKNMISTSPNHPYAQLMPIPTHQQQQQQITIQQQQMTNHVPLHQQPMTNQVPAQQQLMANQIPSQAPSMVSLPQQQQFTQQQQPQLFLDPSSQQQHFVDHPQPQLSHQPSMTSLQAAQQVQNNQQSIMPEFQSPQTGISQMPNPGSRPQSRNGQSQRPIKSAIKYHGGGNLGQTDNNKDGYNSEDDFEIPNNHLAQKKQVDLSSDIGMKCSQI